MDIVLFHSGNKLPSFLECTFRQIRVFNPDTNVHFITDRAYLGSEVFHKYNILPVDKDTCYSDDIHYFEVLYGRGINDFWTITTTRLVYIANFIRDNNLKNVYHFENDVLLYADLTKYEQIFRKLYKDLAITIGGSDKAITGFMFIRNYSALSHMTNFLMGLLKSHKIRDIRWMYKMDMVNEMTLMRVYSKQYPELMVSLPILPFGEFSKGYKEFDSIFDPASWGQYVGGTMEGIPGAKPEDHYIGQLLRENLDYTVVWDYEDKGRVPYFRWDNHEVKINNLHIHSKQLNKYLS